MTQSRNPLMLAALQYATRGWEVFALAARSKTPRRGSHGCLDATTETATIERWWKEEPQANVAIATGPQSGLLVLDIDLRNGGDGSLDELERRFGALPDTPTVLTSGGWHLYFRHPLAPPGNGGHAERQGSISAAPTTTTTPTSRCGEALVGAADMPPTSASDNTRRVVRPDFGEGYPGIDLKADRGYVVAPPSIHPDGDEYRWKLTPEECPVAALPEVWLELLNGVGPGDPTYKRPKRRRSRDPRARTAGQTPGLVQRLRPGERHKALVSLAGRLVNAGLGSENQLRAALRCCNEERCDPPLPEAEVDRLARDAATWEPSRGTSVSPAHGVPPPHDPDGHATDEPPRVITGTDVEKLVRATSWLWPGWIADGHITVLAGESGVGKSWLALALARSVIHGLPWPDGQANELKPGPVFWLESEGRLGVLVERSHALDVDLSGFRFMEQPLLTYYLDQQPDYKTVVDSVVLSQARLLIVDAWSKSLAGSENDADVRFCLDDLQTLARTMAIPVVLVHHLRKKQLGDYAEGFDFDRLRGSSVLSQMATCVIGVDQPTRGVPHCRVSCGKANLAQPPKPFGFAVTGGFQKGVPATLTFGAPPERLGPGSRLDEARDFLRQALADGPRPASEVKEEAKAAGIAEETLKRARRGVAASIRERGGHNRWLWALVPAPPDGNDETHGHLDLVS